MDSEQQFKEIRTLCVLMIDKLDKISAEFREMFGAHKRNSDDIILDYQDVCQILHISLRHLRRLANSNELPGFKIGRRRFWRNYDVQEYIRKIETKNQSINSSKKKRFGNSYPHSSNSAILLSCSATFAREINSTRPLLQTKRVAS